LCVLAMTSFVISQDRAKAPVPASPDSSVAAAAPVLIIHGFCPDAIVAQSDEEVCARRITRAEFGSLITALDPKMPQSNRLALATESVGLLTLPREAERLKLAKTPELKLLEDFNRLQLMERQLVRKLSADSSVSDAEVAAAFAKNQQEYEEGIVRRVLVPKGAPNSTTNELEQVQAIRKRVVAGGEKRKKDSPNKRPPTT